MDYYPLPKILRHPVPILNEHDILRIDGEPYLPAGRRLDGYNFVHQQHVEQRIFLKFDDINNRLDAKSAQIEYGRSSPESQFLQLLFAGKQFSEFSEKVQRVARLREQLFRKYDEQCLVKGHINRSSADFDNWILPQWKKVLGPLRSDSVSTIIAPSVSSFNRLYREWLKYNRSILAIVPRHSGPGTRTLTYTAESLDYAVVEARNFMSDLKPKKTEVFADYEAALHKENEQRKAEGKLQLHRLGKTKFSEIIDSFPAYDVMVARDGVEAALKHFAPNLRMFDETYLGQRIEIDEWKTDLMTIWASAGMLSSATKEQLKILKKIRVWVVVIIDVATRYVLAAKVAKTPNSQAALDTLRLMLIDKTHLSNAAGATTPWIGRVKPSGTAYMDNGSAFLADETIDALNALSVEATRPEAGKPKGRPHIESLFHIIGPLFTRFFEGRTFRSIKEKGDYDPKAHASLAASEFNEIIIAGICDMYNIRAHSALGGQSPHNRFVDIVEGYGWMRPPDQMEVIRAFGKPDTATVGRYGIVKLGIPYSNEWLVEQHMDRGQKPFEIYHDLGYLNSILVKGDDGGWVEVENKIDLPSDLMEVEWAEARKEDLAQNRAETAEDYVAMRDAILRNRENGKAAALRAGLDPATPKPAKMEKHRKQLYRNFLVAPTSGAAIGPDVPMVAPPDELRGGTVGRLRPPELEPTPMPVPNTSKFQRSQWDDE